MKFVQRMFNEHVCYLLVIAGRPVIILDQTFAFFSHKISEHICVYIYKTWKVNVNSVGWIEIIWLVIRKKFHSNPRKKEKKIRKINLTSIDTDSSRNAFIFPNIRILCIHMCFYLFTLSMGFIRRRWIWRRNSWIRWANK